MSRRLFPRFAAAVAAALTVACSAGDTVSPTADTRSRTDRLPDFDLLRAALTEARNADNGGFDLDMWATVVDRDGRVVAVTFTGERRGDQWIGSRAISAQKANAANAFSLTPLALSTANLYSAVQPGGSLYGLQSSNPQDPEVIYGGRSSDWGTIKDYMVGRRPGGINVFGGGLALYNSRGEIIGALGVSGDASCADHNIAWRMRDILGLDNLAGGVSPEPRAFDNIVYDITNGRSASGWGHPECSPAATTISRALPTTHPIGPNR